MSNRRKRPEGRVFPEDIAPGGACIAGARRFARRRGLDWRAFIREGLPIEEVEAMGDENAKAIAAAARRREARS